MADFPEGRKKNVTEGGKGVKIRGEGLGTGPVGKGTSFHGSEGSQSSQPDINLSGGKKTGDRPQHSSAPLRGGGISVGTIVLIIIIFFVLRSCGGSDTDTSYYEPDTYTQTEQQTAQPSQPEQTQVSQGSDTTSSLLSALFGGGGSFSNASDYGNWVDSSYQMGRLDTSVAEGAREKRTVIKGDGTDKNVILVYMCGTDLESKHSMASRDLQEMARATLSDAVKIYVYTGGCKRWQTSGISNSANQIYEVVNGGLKCLDPDHGRGTMVDPNTLADFLNWAKNNTSGNRYDLILWDHGGGSVSGFGYDEKNPRAGSMNLANIGKALKTFDKPFDFIGFDACLMATVENALVVSDYADYLIASEETEPGVGWYYTTWLNELSKDPGKPTVEIGQTIVDTFTNACSQSAAGQKTTLSVVDLAELELTVPDALRDFASSTSKLITGNEYQTVSDARSGAREFASSSKIDQVDLVHLAMNMGTPEGTALAEKLRSAVKYNRTSNGMTNSYGLSIYFPMKRSSSVDSMVSTYEAIGMDEEYTRVIQEAASMNVYGQVAQGGTADTYDTLFSDAPQSSSGTQSVDALSQLLSAFLSSDFSSVEGLDASNTAFLGRGVGIDTAAAYIAGNSFPADKLVWQEDENGRKVISMDEDAWSKISEVAVCMYYYDGRGYVELGLDNAYEIDANGNLLAPDDTWLSIEGQPVPFYYTDRGGSTTNGYVPALLNDERVNLLLVFDEDNPFGAIKGASSEYEADVEVMAKNLTEINPGDRIDFICDYYDESGEYSDTYFIGDTLVIEDSVDDLTISYTDVGDDKIRILYRFTDLYGQYHWTPPLEQ